MSKRYAIFLSQPYYPAGGAADFIGRTVDKSMLEIAQLFATRFHDRHFPFGAGETHRLTILDMVSEKKWVADVVVTLTSRPIREEERAKYHLPYREDIKLLRSISILAGPDTGAAAFARRTGQDWQKADPIDQLLPYLELRRYTEYVFFIDNGKVLP